MCEHVRRKGVTEGVIHCTKMGTRADLYLSSELVMLDELIPILQLDQLHIHTNTYDFASAHARIYECDECMLHAYVWA